MRAGAHVGVRVRRQLSVFLFPWWFQGIELRSAGLHDRPFYLPNHLSGHSLSAVDSGREVTTGWGTVCTAVLPASL